MVWEPRVVVDPTGLHSVIPHPWVTSTPKSFSSSWIIDLGTADPPESINENSWGFLFCFLISANRPSQIVGTPQAAFTLSLSIKEKRLAPSSAAPGNTNFAPTKGTANGSPQAFAWNSGTTGRTVEDGVSPTSAANVSMPKVCNSIER